VKFNVVIPARFASTRLPGKALLKIKGKPIVQYVYENACDSGAEKVIIATDDQRIADCAQAFNAEVCLTSKQHQSGTDRIAEVVNNCRWSDDIVIVNVQGDEPMMAAENIRQVAENLHRHSAASMSTLCTNIIDKKEYQNNNVVKVIRDENGFAQSFSRTAKSIGHDDYNNLNAYRHLGIYAYRVGFLNLFTKLPQSALEKQESLEQLRIHGRDEKIYVDVCNTPAGIGVDTQEDYEMLLEIM
jgi:3-deoxy-manno-octulosonate cytidylyltransferase (CMP-KDO synthetase)